MEINTMIITPNELQEWVVQEKFFYVIDFRTEEQQKKLPLPDLNKFMKSINEIENDDRNPKVYICQYGLRTESLIAEQNLECAYSLLGGALAWESLADDIVEHSKWSRQISLPEIGNIGQKKISQATVTVVGIGGLGCPAASILAACGVGKIILVDGDKVELSNLHRQPIYGIEDIGKMKVDVASYQLLNKYEELQIDPVAKYINEENGKILVQGSDIIIDATDNYESRAVIDSVSKEFSIPMVYGGLYRFEGQVSIFNYQGGPSYRDIFPEAAFEKGVCSDAGVIGMLPGIIGNIQALEAIKILVGIEPNLSGNLLMYDGLSHKTTTIKLKKKI